MKICVLSPSFFTVRQISQLENFICSVKFQIFSHVCPEALLRTFTFIIYIHRKPKPIQVNWLEKWNVFRRLSSSRFAFLQYEYIVRLFRLKQIFLRLHTLNMKMKFQQERTEFVKGNFYEKVVCAAEFSIILLHSFVCICFLEPCLNIRFIHLRYHPPIIFNVCKLFCGTERAAFSFFFSSFISPAIHTSSRNYVALC